MIKTTDTPLSHLAKARLSSLEDFDKKSFPEKLVYETSSDQPVISLAKTLKRTKQSQYPTILAEVKRASPTLGKLTHLSPEKLCEQYLDLGVPGISVLVDPIHFDGHPEHIKRCKEHYPKIPFLFKDFVMTPYQVHLAKFCGASAVLLMTQLLNRSSLEKLHRLSQTLGLESFIEVHHYDELNWAVSLNPNLIGINARDFETKGMPIDLNTAPRLLNLREQQEGHWPDQITLVAQSGLGSLTEVDELQLSCPPNLPDAVQIGSALSKDGGDWIRL